MAKRTEIPFIKSDGKSEIKTFSVILHNINDR